MLAAASHGPRSNERSTTRDERSARTCSRLDLRDMIRRSAMGLSVPAALATVGFSTDRAVARSTSESGLGSLQATREEQRMGGGLSQARLERMHEVMASHVES